MTETRPGRPTPRKRHLDAKQKLMLACMDRLLADMAYVESCDSYYTRKLTLKPQHIERLEAMK